VIQVGMLYGGIHIYESPLLPADWYLIEDWHNAQASAVPQYTKIWIVEGRHYAHPALLKLLKELADERIGY
jgi:hypothetical protein